MDTDTICAVWCLCVEVDAIWFWSSFSLSRKQKRVKIFEHSLWKTIDQQYDLKKTGKVEVKRTPLCFFYWSTQWWMYACECKTAMPKPVTLDREREARCSGYTHSVKTPRYEKVQKKIHSEWKIIVAATIMSSLRGSCRYVITQVLFFFQ